MSRHCERTSVMLSKGRHGSGHSCVGSSAGAAPESPGKPFLSFSEVALLVQRLNAEGPRKGQVPPAGS